jgi:hypothetical protein
MESLKGGKRHVSVGEDQMLRQLSKTVELDDIESIKKLLKTGVPFMEALRKVARAAEQPPTTDFPDKEVTDPQEPERTY